MIKKLMWLCIECKSERFVRSAGSSIETRMRKALLLRAHDLQLCRDSRLADESAAARSESDEPN